MKFYKFKTQETIFKIRNQAAPSILELDGHNRIHILKLKRQKPYHISQKKNLSGLHKDKLSLNFRKWYLSNL